MSKKEPTSAYLRRRLDELKGRHIQISEESGVPQSTVSRIYQGKGSPRLETVEPLLAWFDRYDASAVRRSRSGQRGVRGKKSRLVQRPAQRAAAAPLGQ